LLRRRSLDQVMPALVAEQNHARVGRFNFGAARA